LTMIAFSVASEMVYTWHDDAVIEFCEFIVR